MTVNNPKRFATAILKAVKQLRLPVLGPGAKSYVTADTTTWAVTAIEPLAAWAHVILRVPLQLHVKECRGDLKNAVHRLNEDLYAAIIKELGSSFQIGYTDGYDGRMGERKKLAMSLEEYAAGCECGELVGNVHEDKPAAAEEAAAPTKEQLDELGLI